MSILDLTSKLCYTLIIMILYFDTETTGLRPGRIIQLAYILDYGDKIIAKNFYFNVPYIEPGASMVHGITLEKLEVLSKGKVFYDYMDEIESDFKEANLIVAHNFNFDFNFMSNEFKLNFKTFTYKESLDTMRYFTPILKLSRPYGRGIKYPKLEELCECMDVYPFEISAFVKDHFGVDASHNHDATYDTAAMFLAVKNGLEKIPELAEYLKKFNTLE